MATVTVKRIPDDLYRRLKLAAAAHRRSVNSEIIVCIERAVDAHRQSEDDLLARARMLRARVGGRRLTDRQIGRAKATGRA